MLVERSANYLLGCGQGSSQAHPCTLRSVVVCLVASITVVVIRGIRNVVIAGVLDDYDFSLYAPLVSFFLSFFFLPLASLFPVPSFPV